jgi:Dna[CI] antecedent, DciA
VESIAPGVEKLLAGSLRRAPAAVAPLLAWPVICGSAVAARTRALEFSDGLLQVEVPDFAWRAELQHLAPRYVAIANKYAVGVNRIEFVVRNKGTQNPGAGMRK